MRQAEIIHAPDPLRLTPEVPTWLRYVLNEKMPEEVAEFMEDRSWRRQRHKIGSRSEAADFLLDRRTECFWSLWDHSGTSLEDNLVTEPYAGNCAICRKEAANLAEQLGLRCEITDLTWHAPHIKECIRITFFKPELEPRTPAKRYPRRQILGRERWYADRETAYRRATAEYFAECIADALQLCPNPEFQHALELLSGHAKGRISIEELREKLKDLRRMRRFFAGYNPTGELYRVIRYALWKLARKHIGTVMSSDTQGCAEAHWLANRPLDTAFDFKSETAMHNAYERHHRIMHRIFDDFYIRFGGDWKAAKARMEMIQ